MINQKEYEILKDLDDRMGWLARDRDGDLVAYEKKPEKSTRFWFDNGRVVNLGVIFDVGRLFQFIQWNDEEPYRISDLIKEYEIKELRLAPSGTVIVDSFSESEETEVKKNKEWAQKEVDRYLSYEGVNEARNALVFAKRVIDQLDEPVVPVVPEDVYEHIKMNKAGGVPLDIALDGAIGKLEILGRDGIQFHEFRNNQDNYAKAWLAYPDIEIEEEPLYYVMKDGVVILSKIDEYHQLDKSRWIGAVTNKEYIKENLDKVRFTEHEIKDFDERFWAFAVPVEELEE